MPAIALRYLGDDPKELARCDKDGIRMFEPVDAREVIASQNPDYEISEEHAALIGEQFDPETGKRLSQLNIPQLQGGDEDLQTGLSVMKYARNQVHMAHPGGPQSTTGQPVAGNVEEVGAHKERVHKDGGDDPDAHPPGTGGEGDEDQEAQPAAKATRRTRRK